MKNRKITFRHVAWSAFIAPNMTLTSHSRIVPSVVGRR